ncbi:MAG: CoA transferase [Dehalococcoidales bacterium]|nr:CoA transferase [Dehalococcoidales bacterium]
MTGKQVLNHIRILDFTRVLAGPYATRILADFGAEIIKIQPPGLPPAVGAFAQGYYNTWNRNKRSITLNLDKPEGLALAKRLVAICDAVCENFSPRVMVNWGLGYANLQEIKPDIIMLSMSLMGSTGPLRNYIGFGPTVQAFSGITGLTGFQGQSSSGLGFSYADHVAGLYGALALLSALEHRRRTGEGQFIDLSETETMISLIGETILDDTAHAKKTKPLDNRSGEAAPHNVYRCRGDDRWVAIAVFTDEEWQHFKNALGNPSWAEDNKFATPEGRRQNTDELDKMITDWTVTLTAEEVMAFLQSHGIAAGVVQDAKDLAHNFQLRARGFFTNMDNSTFDASPIKMSRSEVSRYRAAPSANQDNHYVYGELLGISDTEIARLSNDGVI